MQTAYYCNPMYCKVLERFLSMSAPVKVLHAQVGGRDTERRTPLSAQRMTALSWATTHYRGSGDCGATPGMRCTDTGGSATTAMPIIHHTHPQFILQLSPSQPVQSRTEGII